MAPVFEWDNRKAKSNFRKHRVQFTEAASVFSDPMARIFPDEAHSGNEAREIIVGHTEQVVHHIRIISARLATKTEERDYEEHLKV